MNSDKEPAIKSGGGGGVCVCVCMCVYCVVA